MELRSELSRQYISEALILLLEKTEYQKITIQDIVDKAGLSRMAYYRNFECKDDIIKYYLHSITTTFIRRTDISYENNQFGDYIVTLFQHLSEYKLLGMTLLRAGLLHYVKDEFDSIFAAKCQSAQESYRYYFISGGLYNLYYFWLKNGCQETPEELASLIIQVHYPGLLSETAPSADEPPVINQ